jgi:HSP90 family molecular chaperone
VEKDKEDEAVKGVAQTLFDAALVQGDFELVDKTRFTQSVVALLNDKVRACAARARRCVLWLFNSFC